MGISSNYAKPLAAAGLVLAVGACSWFGGDAPPRRAGAETKEPNLASVPAKPTPVLSAEQRKALTQQLVRDRENARYTDQQFRIGNVPEAAPPRPAPQQPTTARPATAARPSQPSAPAATPPAAEPAPAPAEAAAKKESDDSPWWWPFGGSSKEEEKPAAAPAASDAAQPNAAPAVAATPDNMQASSDVMPVTGKPLPRPDQPAEYPAPLAMAPVPPTAPRGSGVPVGTGQPGTAPASPVARAPDAATVPVMPSVSTAPEPPARMVPDAPGAAPPPAPALAAVPPAPPPPPAGAGAGPGVSKLAAQIEFPEAGATLSDAGRQALQEVEKLHREHGGRIRVVALTPRGGAAVAGEALLAAASAATERGNSVMRELVRLGVPEGDISVRTAPGAGGRDPRRVDTYIEY
jgi:hypothetical protein